MEICASLIILLILKPAFITSGKEQNHHHVVIHVPYKIKHYYHTHTIIKHIRHKEDKEDKFEFLGYSVGKPEEIKDDLAMKNPIQEFADVGHSFQDSEHTVFGSNENKFQEQHNDVPNPEINNEDFKYYHSDGNEYGFEGAGHHVDDNYGEKIPDYEKQNFDMNEGYGEKVRNFPAKDFSEVEYEFGAKDPNLAKEISETDYNFGMKEHTYNYATTNPDYAAEILENDGGFGGKNIGYGKKFPEMSDYYGIKNYGYGKDIAEMENGYQKEVPEIHMTYGYDKDYEKNGVNEHNYEKEVHQISSNYDSRDNEYEKERYNVDQGFGDKIPGYSIDDGNIQVRDHQYGKEVYQDDENTYGEEIIEENYESGPSKFPSIRDHSYSKEIVHRYPNNEEYTLNKQSHNIQEESFIGGSYDEGEYDYEEEYNYK